MTRLGSDAHTKFNNLKVIAISLIFATAICYSPLLLAQQPASTARSASENAGVIHFGSGVVAFYSARAPHVNRQIYVMASDGNNQIRVTSDTSTDTDPDISPNGREMVFTSNAPGNNDIFLLDRWGNFRNLTNNSADDEWARFSPNGRAIVFGSNRDGNVYEVFISNVRTGATRRLTDPPVLSRYPSWSPDGEQIAFRRGIDIYVTNADGTGSPTQLTHEALSSFAQMPAFSPDGKYIAFMSLREGYCSVFRMEIDGSNQVNLTPRDPSIPANIWCSRAPSWSADGTEIYFMSSRIAGQNQVFVMNADGTNVRQLTTLGTNGSPRARVGEDDEGDDE